MIQEKTGALIIALLFLALSCTRSLDEKVKEIKLAMSLEEVQSKLGRPELIQPGYAELQDKRVKLMQEVFEQFLRERSLSILPALQKDPLYVELLLYEEYQKQKPEMPLGLLGLEREVNLKVETVGQLNYETWYYRLYDTLNGFAISLPHSPKGKSLKEKAQLVPAFKLLRRFGVCFSRATNRVVNHGFWPHQVFDVQTIPIDTLRVESSGR